MTLFRVAVFRMQKKPQYYSSIYVPSLFLSLSFPHKSFCFQVFLRLSLNPAIIQSRRTDTVFIRGKCRLQLHIVINTRCMDLIFSSMLLRFFIISSSISLHRSDSACQNLNSPSTFFRVKQRPVIGLIFSKLTSGIRLFFF